MSTATIETTFTAALAHAREAVDDALDALNTIEKPYSEYVLPLLQAQKELQLASSQYQRHSRTV